MRLCRVLIHCAHLDWKGEGFLHKMALLELWPWLICKGVMVSQYLHSIPRYQCMTQHNCTALTCMLSCCHEWHFRLHYAQLAIGTCLVVATKLAAMPEPSIGRDNRTCNQREQALGHCQ